MAVLGLGLGLGVTVSPVFPWTALVIFLLSFNKLLFAPDMFGVFIVHTLEEEFLLVYVQ